MKLVKTIGIFLLLGAAALFGAKAYTQNQSGELPGVLDQLNPLVTEGEVYVKTKEANEVIEHGIAVYKQEAVDKEGKKRAITFTADHELIQDRYLKIYNKGAHVETYEEVTKDQVPQQALDKIG
ncbi:YxeA family protein [Enterococcus sp. DIV0242_7C1]|uniref:YxeA family protein n=1 Tax=Candidatus Enterococcus dunnyi TaxID=1834192 RepID=A0A200JF53_9ENTE|nr:MULTISPECIES: YxeA family protein [unclassified Enterococcus]MBO0469295.1 YxeA family protein [Enterococcus sp. DIV0242_7C1]MCA5012878.1 YxeA family protein [Enterococcus sp. S23]MCA5016129.1 YxeA family protein [Enterococcus sp. S22(2020)]OUZ35410.1 hypothetical protein A5889_000886 [Enterococcus sp. 9D6_DIV0238]